MSDNQYENHDEDSEYHFSEDAEMNYDGHAPKPADQVYHAAPARSNVKPRIIMSGLIFFALVFVVYKLVAPGSSAPSTKIVEAANTSQNSPGKEMSKNTPASTAAAPAANTMANAAPVAPVVNIQQPMAAPAVVAAPSTVAQQQPSTSATTAPTVQQPVTAAAIPQPQEPSGVLPPQTVPVVATMPAVIPVESVQPMLKQPLMDNSGSSLPASVNSQVGGLSAETERLINDLHAQYAQRLNDYATQNKNLQDQLQSLNSRMLSLETALHQVTQSLLRQQNEANSTTSTGPETSAAPPPEQQVGIKSSYNVQAIIPGRAWLRSDNGETVTVAEGDVIKDLGRITKINPYDGVVEINTGNKTLSLSYGNTG